MTDDDQDETVALRPEAWERLKGTLGDTDSGRRRDSVLASDTRTGDEIESSYDALDRTVELLSERVVPQPHDKPMARIVEPSLLGMGGRDSLSDEERATVAKRCERLYEDIVWLFAVNDGEGALISLERMLMLGHPHGDAREFLETNHDKLLHLYQDYMGPFDRVAVLGEVDPYVEMPAGYLEAQPMAEVLRCVNGKLTITEILENANVAPLVGCAALKQLHRAQVIEFA
jgi:hypothetical protein